MESGEYFLTAGQKASRAEHEKLERQREAQDAKKRKREEPYLPPKVPPLPPFSPLPPIIDHADTLALQPMAILRRAIWGSRIEIWQEFTSRWETSVSDALSPPLPP